MHSHTSNFNLRIMQINNMIQFCLKYNMQRKTLPRRCTDNRQWVYFYWTWENVYEKFNEHIIIANYKIDTMFYFPCMFHSMIMIT